MKKIEVKKTAKKEVKFFKKHWKFYTILLFIILVFIAGFLGFKNLKKIHYYNIDATLECGDYLRCDLNNKLITGVINTYYKNGKLKLKATFKNGKLNGEFKGYYENGNLEFETNYENGKSYNVEKTFYENGNLKTEENFKDVSKTGILKTYYENGKLEVEINYQNYEPVSGVCYTTYGKKKILNPSQLYNFDKGAGVNCDVI